MTPTLTAPDPAIFPEYVRRFAAERGVTQYLAPLYQLAKRCFDGAEVTVTFQSDYEIPDLHWIVYEVDAGRCDGERRRAGRSCFTAEKVRTLPPDARGAFALRVR